MLGYQILIPVAVIMIGMACGSAFSLCMMFFSLRTTDGQRATELSGVAQSFGYLLAAVGPTLFGALHDLTGGGNGHSSCLLFWLELFLLLR